ncbi:SPFH domain / Band 7 family protein [Enhygromyxa salina]|uniref:SPFH domain / Band 7 family protein n=1 Tax=Enhygromyxa salina TaxID=215803 RepID=A0A2S9XKJ5_9BACT|nr:SPFH domain-containing protein [Enhygromyxa salina]PRP93406.1 SPFH domain / Band 7 family protein [Enhygromyxa salina]
MAEIDLEKFKQLREQAGGATQWIWVGASALIVVVMMFMSFTTLEPGEVAVRVNNISGSAKAITQPGWVFRMPFGVHSLHVLDVSPQTFLMKGEQSVDDLQVEKLTVRASDGANFHFSDTTLIFQVVGDEAVTVARDAGVEYMFRAWIKPYARAILRDEFGRESTITVSDPSNYGAAATRAQDRLNEALRPHGVVVTQMVTPRPKFNADYEHLIEERNRLRNELEVIKSNLERAETDRQRTLSEVDRDENKKIQERRAELESELATAVADRENAIRAADTYRIETIGVGQAKLAAARRKAEELQGQLEADYRAKKAEVEAFRTQPVERVMERLGESLEDVTINIEPWANDANPSRVVLDQ